MKNLIIIILSLLIAGILVFHFYRIHSVEELAESGIQMTEEAESGDLSDRFTSAYSSQSASIAIWEGTNLASFRDKNWTPPYSPEQKASLALLHARLYALYKEVGMSNEMLWEAGQADKWVRAISTNLIVSPEFAATKLLEKDSVKRLGNNK